jgi:hypothetical protein
MVVHFPMAFLMGSAGEAGEVALDRAGDLYPIVQFELWQQPRLWRAIALILSAFIWWRQLARKCCRYRT